MSQTPNNLISQLVQTKYVTIVVLNDGETFSDISGCSICTVPLADYERVTEEGGDAKDFTPISKVGFERYSIAN